MKAPPRLTPRFPALLYHGSLALLVSATAMGQTADTNSTGIHASHEVGLDSPANIHQRFLLLGLMAVLLVVAIVYMRKKTLQRTTEGQVGPGTGNQGGAA